MVNFYIFPQLMLASYALAATVILFGGNDTLKATGLFLSIAFSLATRILTIVTFFSKGGKLGWTEILYSIVSHMVFFSSMVMFIPDQFVISNPTNTLVDAIFYSSDVLATIGTSEFKPKTPVTKLIETFHNLDAYFLLIILGFQIIQASNSNKELSLKDVRSN